MTQTTNPIHDEILATPALHRREMRFRCRIFENPPMTIALLTDLGDENPGCSITNGIEYAVNKVLERWPEINPARLVIIEHYDDRQTIQHLAARYGRYHAEHALLGRENGECFDLVTFGAGLEAVRQRARGTIPTAVEPQWKHVGKTDVEQLIGGELP